MIDYLAWRLQVKCDRLAFVALALSFIFTCSRTHSFSLSSNQTSLTSPLNQSSLQALACWQAGKLASSPQLVRPLSVLPARPASPQRCLVDV